jgi:hypothetical protein
MLPTMLEEGRKQAGWSTGSSFAVMKKRGPAEFPGQLTGEVILHSDHYDLNEKAERHRRVKGSVARRPRWKRWFRRPTAS